MFRERAYGYAVLFAAALAASACGSIEAPSPDIPMPAPSSLAPALGSTVGGQLIAIEGQGF